MKKHFFIILLFCIFYLNSHAQISLDTIVHPWNLFGYDFYPVQISNSETKYITEDTVTNTFSLYNMDFTPYLLNISVPEPFAPSTKLYEVIYVSKSLFDCDSTNIEYAYAAQYGNGNNRTFYIMRTDGTQLFRLDSAVAPYCFGCLNGSQDIRPIVNTSAGAKLYIYHPQNTDNLEIYSLCGLVPEGMTELHIPKLNSYVRLFPSPANGVITFLIDTPDNFNTYELIIYNSSGTENNKRPINSDIKEYKIDFSSFSSGTYFYKLSLKGKSIQSGKFVISN